MSNNSGPSILSIVSILLLLGLSGFLWYNNSQLKTELAAQKTDYLDLEKVNTELDISYQAKLEELEELRGENQDLNEKIDVQKAELSKQKKRISGLIWSEKELGKARSEIELMTTQADQNIAELARLKKENMALAASNTQLKEENTNLNQTVSVNEKRISHLDSFKTVLVSQTEQLSSTNDRLSDQVDMAEAIKINFIEVKGYDVKDDGSVKERSKSKKVEMLRACFKTETNMVTKPGEKDFYITYTNPAGEILYVEELGSGSLDNKLTGETVRYTMGGTVNYENEDLTACLDWTPNFKLAKGLYKIDIYNNGFQVGKGEFKLK